MAGEPGLEVRKNELDTLGVAGLGVWTFGVLGDSKGAGETRRFVRKKKQPEGRKGGLKEQIILGKRRAKREHKGKTITLQGGRAELREGGLKGGKK